ncbi:MAG TPA: Sec-independent protein translocase protein TatB [Gammaproteobacteria bacterium]|nr:Sec-independent protein translocase protein TatB [Gammaproteobacteria bacterium]
MFEGSFWELSLIFLLALIVFGPERLPGLARTVGLWVGKARSVMRNFNEQIERELAAEEMRRAAAAARGQIESAAAEVKQTAGEAVKRDPPA